MVTELTKDRYEEYEEFNKNHPKGHFMQSVLWAQMKPEWKNVILICTDKNNKIKGSMSVLIRPVPVIKRTIMYSPRGPVCDLDDKETLKELYDGIKKLAKKHKAYVFKADPDVKSDNEVFKQNLKNAGFKITPGSQTFDGIQPCFVFRLDVSGKTEEEIFNNFQSKTRYNVRLSVKKGVTVRLGGKEDINDFQRLMEETGLRDEFVVRPASYFEKMLEVYGDNARLYMADYEGKPIAGTLAIYYGNKVWYLYGASGNAYRNVMPNYQLQWEMIRWSIEKGCDIYDFRGVPGDVPEDHPLYGLVRFKRGFNGEYTEFLGEAEIVFSPFINWAVHRGEQIFRELRRKRYLRKNKNK
ncbi:MAG: peptidoglycan bridge formation glycyltransferase FemA/FemB family protein [Ruminococcaceae bacterium]|nr:peptidoglycan bridge formation glycyltransferase FemA/FemB family protein [Oscillospiraceae bacterium]